MAPRPDVSEERKQQILDAAVVLFIRQGFHKARMDDIAKEAGLSKGALYWYFKSKDEIILSLMERLFALEFEDVNQLLVARIPAGERLQLLFEHMATMFQEHFAQLMPVIYEYYASAVRQEDVRGFLRTYFHGYLKMLQAFIDAGINTREFRSDIDAAEVAFVIASFWEGVAFLWLIDEQKVDLRHFSASTVQILLSGMLHRDAD